MACIYKIINDINGKLYIGETIYSIQYRWKQHIYYFRKLLLNNIKITQPLYLAFQKYGIENFHIELVEECYEDIRFEREQYYISLYNTYGSNGYNATLGGEGAKKLSIDDELEILSAFLTVGSIVGAKHITGRCNRTISGIIHKYNFQTRRDEINKIDYNAIIGENIEGKTYKEIAEKYNINEATIVKKIKQKNIPTARQRKNNEIAKIDIDNVLILRDKGLTIAEIVNELTQQGINCNEHIITAILNEHGYITSKFLNDKLNIDEIKKYYQQTKSIKQTAEHFNITRKALTQYLSENNIQINSINIPISVTLHKENILVGFETLMDCAKFVQQNYLPNYTSLRGIRDHISDALKSKKPYKDIYFIKGEVAMTKVRVNPDEQLVKEIKKKIKLNNGHCACCLIPTDDNKCMCKAFREQIERNEPGECHCGLYEIVINE